MGAGLSLVGGTLKNAGVVSLAAGSANLIVNNDGAGNVTITDNSAGGGAGLVSLGPAALQVDSTNNPSIGITKTGAGNLLQLATGASPVDRFVVAASGAITTGTISWSQITSPPTIVSAVVGTANQVNASTVAGTVTLSLPQDIAAGSSPAFAGLTLGSALSVGNGGTGQTAFTANGVLVGNGTSGISSVVAGGGGLCLMSSAGAPVWSACPGGSGVVSLNALSGTLAIAGVSAGSVTSGGSTITINDATAAVKGLASFNSTNLSLIFNPL